MALPQFVSRSFHFVFSQLFGNYVFPPLSSFITVTTVSLYDCSLLIHNCHDGQSL